MRDHTILCQRHLTGGGVGLAAFLRLPDSRLVQRQGGGAPPAVVVEEAVWTEYGCASLVSDRLTEMTN